MAEIPIKGHVVLLDEPDVQVLAGREWGIERRGEIRYVRATSHGRRSRLAKART